MATQALKDEVDRPPFGQRFLTENHDVWSHSAWDSVPPPTDQDEIIEKSLNRQRAAPVQDTQKYNATPFKYWDVFYKNNTNNFFRDRKWLPREFPELLALATPDAGERVIVEVGCGAGNTALPLLSANENPHLTIHACDYAPTAVEVVKQSPLYSAPPTGTIRASVWDLSSTTQTMPEGVQEHSVDAVVMIFVLSALSPSEWAQAVANVHQMLKPGGLILLRDYGRHDLTQLRFKEGRLLEENFYIRGDGTRVYFFEIDELARLFTGKDAPEGGVDVVTSTGTEGEGDDGPASTSSPTESGPSVQSISTGLESLSMQDMLSGAATPTQDTATTAPSKPENEAVATETLPLESGSAPSSSQSNPEESSIPPTSTSMTSIADLAQLPHPLFSIVQLRVDRRLLLNRKRQLKMYRVWMQAKFRKI
ncbi:methyltransferase [Clavulina sp. PMI_390]|nr:methyltransferase [Clavulina sp. PMI_390]